LADHCNISGNNARMPSINRLVTAETMTGIKNFLIRSSRINSFSGGGNKESPFENKHSILYSLIR